MTEHGDFRAGTGGRALGGAVSGSARIALPLEVSAEPPSFRLDGRSIPRGQPVPFSDGRASDVLQTGSSSPTVRDAGAGHAADLQHADSRERGVPSHRARTRADVRVRHDRLRLLSPRPRTGARGLRRGRPLSAQHGLSRHLRAQHHRYRRQDHRPSERERRGLSRTHRALHRLHARGLPCARGAGAGCRTAGDALHRPDRLDGGAIDGERGRLSGHQR